MGSMVAKPNAKKIRRIGETVIAGFAGSAADGLVSLSHFHTRSHMLVHTDL
jgi:ATP-dependent HslUV protease subunit HslV